MDGALFAADIVESKAILQLEKERAEVPRSHLSRLNKLLEGLNQPDSQAGLEAAQLSLASLHLDCRLQLVNRLS